MINLLPDYDVLEFLHEQENKEIELANFLAQFLPRRFAHAWCAIHFSSQPLKRFTPRQLAEIAEKLNN